MMKPSVFFRLCGSNRPNALEYLKGCDPLHAKKLVEYTNPMGYSLLHIAAHDGDVNLASMINDILNDTTVQFSSYFMADSVNPFVIALKNGYYSIASMECMKRALITAEHIIFAMKNDDHRALDALMRVCLYNRPPRVVMSPFIFCEKTLRLREAEKSYDRKNECVLCAAIYAALSLRDIRTLKIAIDSHFMSTEGSVVCRTTIHRSTGATITVEGCQFSLNPLERISKLLVTVQAGKLPFRYPSMHHNTSHGKHVTYHLSKVLVDCGADPSYEDCNGVWRSVAPTTLHVAIEHGEYYNDALQFLSLANYEKIKAHLQSLLELAVQCRRTEIVFHLLKMRTNEPKTLLAHAIKLITDRWMKWRGRPISTDLKIIDLIILSGDTQIGNVEWFHVPEDVRTHLTTYGQRMTLFGMTYIRTHITEKMMIDDIDLDTLFSSDFNA